MAEQIPGRRISTGESFYTDWMSRGGDSMILRAEALKVVGTGSPKVTIVVQHRTEPAATVTDVTPTYVPSGSALELTSAAVFTGYYQANLKAEVRLKVSCTGTDAYLVVRVFPPIFFDEAK